MKHAIQVRVEGRVQGVGFRYWTVGKARELGLTGWVRNEPNGDVTAHFEGEDAALSDMLSSLWQGPQWSQVTNVVRQAATARGFVGFDVDY